MEIQKQKAITLIALVITIIILLIIAGVTITQLIGENGLIAKMEEAKIKQLEAQAKEDIELTIIDTQIKNEQEEKTTTPIIETTTPIIGTTNPPTDSVDDNSQVKRTTLYINFSATIDEGICTVSPTLPYEITSNGTYTFIVTGTYGEGKTTTKEVEVTVEKYIELTSGVVQYNAGNWTQSEIQALQNKNLYNINTEKTASDTAGLNFTFGGFTYAEDTTNQSYINNGTVITSRNQSVSPQSGFGIPKYDGWEILDSYESNGKTYVTKIVHAGAPENFVYYYTTSYDAYKAEYILSNGARQTSYNTYQARNWDMYKDQSQLNLISEVHCMTYEEANAISSSSDAKRATRAYYWLASALNGNYFWLVRNDGIIGGNYSLCWGVRPVVTMNSGVFISRGTGTERDPYILAIE